MVKFALLAKIFLLSFCSGLPLQPEFRAPSEESRRVARMALPQRPSTSLRFAQDDKIAMLFCQFFVYFSKGFHRELQVLA
jgi:hypothetical protein